MTWGFMAMMLLSYWLNMERNFNIDVSKFMAADYFKGEGGIDPSNKTCIERNKANRKTGYCCKVISPTSVAFFSLTTTPSF